MNWKQIDDQLVNKLKRLKKELALCDSKVKGRRASIWAQIRAVRWDLEMHRADGKVVI